MAKDIITGKQDRFVQAYFASGRDANQAYRAAYDAKDMADESVRVEASKLLRDPKIALRIKEEQELLSVRTGFTPLVALKKWLDIATADPRELVELKVFACRHCFGEGGNYQWDEASFDAALRKCSLYNEPLPDTSGGFGYTVDTAPNPSCLTCAGAGERVMHMHDTSNLSDKALLLYGGVKQTRNGIEMILADRTKALENACRIIGAFKDNVRLDGTIGQMIQAVTTTDPIEAARVYQDLMRRTSVTH